MTLIRKVNELLAKKKMTLRVSTVEGAMCILKALDILPEKLEGC